MWIFLGLQAAFPCQIAAYYKGLACMLPDYLIGGHVQAAFCRQMQCHTPACPIFW
ncbi:hypothetical protein HMPREF9098_1893 [Kingella denitrificans ATCC 33394]|uniref:Uncharacterized protein n=1 Tax=Kingella denitrificans ATCC 33394 TaxID=888741 RepID=F0F1A8_9NEIS|nr:hypothetical protein HMPREF9098_1893 [Kingella denitrificans ATCC 33394]